MSWHSYFPTRALSAAALAIASLSLQGCDIPKHTLGNWREKESYLVKYEYIAPGQDSSTAQLNSCSVKDLATSLQCNGHGTCEKWYEGAEGAPDIRFCNCDSRWADPECRTQRKSQLTAFVLSVFLGPFGADQFYLGFRRQGVLKLLTLGGAGIWYLYDLVRIGSAPVLTANKFELIGDLHHAAFVLTLIVLMGILGFALSAWSIARQRNIKAREILLLGASAPTPAAASYGSMAPSGFTGYGQPLG